MDGTRFDRIARQFAASTSRRSLLTAALGGAAGVAGALLQHRAEAAVLRGPGEICRKNGDCASNFCGPADRTGRRRCACSEGQVACDGACVDPETAFASDDDNCGACGVACPTLQSCCDGACVPSWSVCDGVCCASTQVCYEDACCDPLSPVDVCENACGEQSVGCGQTTNCGACCGEGGSGCEGDNDCCSGACVENACLAAPGEVGATCDSNADCGSNACCGGLCVAADAYDDDVENCGACENACPGSDTECGTRTCISGVCGMSYVESGTPTSSGQTPGDCQLSVCDGSGGTESVADDTDVPTEASGACMQPICTEGVPGETPLAEGATCVENGGTVCDGNGNCVECIAGDSCDSGVCLEDGTCCVADEESVTCAEQCGEVENNCGVLVDCGSCCPEGTRPSSIGDYCVPDAATCAAAISTTSHISADLRECDFSGLTLISHNFQYANLTGATFASATLIACNFQFANLTSVDFSGTTLTSNAWAFATCPDGVAANSGAFDCCANMNGNTPASCP